MFRHRIILSISGSDNRMAYGGARKNVKRGVVTRIFDKQGGGGGS